MRSPTRVEPLSVFAWIRSKLPCLLQYWRFYRSSGFVDVKELVASAFLIPPELLWTAGFWSRISRGNGVVGSTWRYHQSENILINQMITRELVAGAGFEPATFGL
jgi:hypothetical protein